jgi:hypothetical protein
MFSCICSKLDIPESIIVTLGMPWRNRNAQAGSFSSGRRVFSFAAFNEAIVSDKNHKVLVKTIKDKMQQDPNVNFPKLYMACGTEDTLIKNNRNLRDLQRIPASKI